MSAPLPGYVYFDPKFPYHDGKFGEKLFVVLCDSPLDNDLIVVTRTTAQKKNNTGYGCNLDDYPPCFYLSNTISNFHKNTWIMLDYLVEYGRRDLENMERKTTLSLDHTIGLLECGANCQYLTEWQKTALRGEAKLLSPK